MPPYQHGKGLLIALSGEAVHQVAVRFLSVMVLFRYFLDDPQDRRCLFGCHASDQLSLE
jgi:hypothetical protein